MDAEFNELRSATKTSKYRDVINELRMVKADENTDIPAFMSAILKIVAQAAHAQAGTLWYYARYMDGRIHAKAVYGGGDLGDFSLAPGEGIAGLVIKNRKGTLVQDCQSDPRWSGKADKDTGFVTKSMICEPIVDGDECFGCIQLINRTDADCFDSADSAFLRKQCDEVSKIFKDHSDDLMIGHFTKDGKGDATWMRAIVDMNDIHNMLEAIHRIPAYKELSDFDAKRFDWHCKRLWKIMH